MRQLCALIHPQVRAYCTANSIRRQKRLYKVVVLLDMKSMGMAHVSKRLMSIVKVRSTRSGRAGRTLGVYGHLL